MAEQLLSFLNNHTIQPYCLQCEAGRELQVVRNLRQRFPGITFIAAQYEKHRSCNGVKRVVSEMMLPGYVFLYSGEPVLFYQVLDSHHVYRFLNYGGAEDYALRGKDRDFALWVLSKGGMLTCSQAIMVGTTVQIVAGPLKDARNIGTVEKIDKHNRNVCLAVDFDGMKRLVWMPFVWVNDLTNNVRVSYDAH